MFSSSEITAIVCSSKRPGVDESFLKNIVSPALKNRLNSVWLPVTFLDPSLRITVPFALVLPAIDVVVIECS